MAENHFQQVRAEAMTMWTLVTQTSHLTAETHQHLLRVQRYTRAIAREAGCATYEAERLGWFSILHDVGKVYVPNSVTLKPGSFTDEERQVMQLHTVFGDFILGGGEFFSVARQIAHSHHERWDGTGYPEGLKSERIPFPARIVAVADVFDALTSRRSYKLAWPIQEALGYVHHQSGRHFDPVVVNAILRLWTSGKLQEILQTPSASFSAPGSMPSLSA